VQRAKLFQNGASQAVRLPKECRFEGGEVYVKQVGRAVVLLPLDGAWDTLRESLELFTEDFMAERAQPEPQARPAFD
jgi:antitoxin VapB